MLHTLLDVNFLVILNLLVLVLGAASISYTGSGRSVLSVILLILAIVAVVFDIVYIVLRLVAS